jgi:hypothetical protein
VLLAGQEQVVWSQPTAWREITTVTAWAFSLVVLLLVAGFWLHHLCTRARLETARRSRWRERQAAEERAEGLLQEHLSNRQYRQLLTRGYLEVPSRLHPGRTYRIPTQPGRVTVYEGGRSVAQLCIIACDPAPYADLILAQKWLIEADEESYLTVANWIEGAPRYQVRR